MDELRETCLGYSLKNIPIPTANEYLKHLIGKVESVLKRMRWRALFFFEGKCEVDPDENEYGFKSRKCPPQIDELKPFEHDMLKLIENIKFRKVSDPFQSQLRKDMRRIRQSPDLIVKADKTRNLYLVSMTQYEKLLRDNITRNYKPAEDHMLRDINKEAKNIAERLKLDRKMDTMAKSEAFITLKDHKDNFENARPCRLINPAKSEIGIISRQVLESIVSTARNKTAVNMWKNTNATIDWFRSIQHKSRHTFITFDIVDFYPSISEDLLRSTSTFAKEYATVTDSDMEVTKMAPLRERTSLDETRQRWALRRYHGEFRWSRGMRVGRRISSERTCQDPRQGNIWIVP